MAHGVAPTHEIFQSPNAVSITLTDQPTPGHYRSYPEGADLPETMAMWKVQTKSYDQPWMDPGIVSSPTGWNEPDSESIAAGLNSKGPNSVALGRHGNYFLWGFFAQPRDLTDEAKKVFVNAVHYIDRFDGQLPLVQRKTQAREDVMLTLNFVKQYPAEQADGMLEYSIDKSIREKFDDDIAEIEAHVSKHLDHIYASGMRSGFSVDEDTLAMGIANNDIAILDACVKALDGKQSDRAKRILKRYTDQDFDNTAQWRSWLKTNRDRLFFSDVGGFRWYVAPEGLPMNKKKASAVQASSK